MKTRALTIQLTDQAFAMLERLTSQGLWGVTPQETATRIIDRSLLDMGGGGGILR